MMTNAEKAAKMQNWFWALGRVRDFVDRLGPMPTTTEEWSLVYDLLLEDQRKARKKA